MKTNIKYKKLMAVAIVWRVLSALLIALIMHAWKPVVNVPYKSEGVGLRDIFNVIWQLTVALPQTLTSNLLINLPKGWLSLLEKSHFIWVSVQFLGWMLFAMFILLLINRLLNGRLGFTKRRKNG